MLALANVDGRNQPVSALDCRSRRPTAAARPAARTSTSQARQCRPESALRRQIACVRRELSDSQQSSSRRKAIHHANYSSRRLLGSAGARGRSVRGAGSCRRRRIAAAGKRPRTAAQARGDPSTQSLSSASRKADALPLTQERRASATNKSMLVELPRELRDVMVVDPDDRRCRGADLRTAYT